MPTLSWFDRDKDRTRAALAPYRLLEPVAKLSYGEVDAPNMLIEGDNLDALKALLPYYAGQVKCIFIDPPYNTQSAFEQYDDNLEHSKWLSMMYPRLELLRQFLTEDGAIWITIDDNEAHYLKVICDEVFFRKNFIATFVWERDKGGRGDAVVSVSNDFVLCYAMDKSIWSKTRNLLQRTPTQAGRFKNPDNDRRGPWRQGDDGTAKSGTEKQRFPITLPSGRVVRPKEGRYWAFSIGTYEQAVREGRVYYGRKGDSLPIIKRYLSEVREGVAPRTWLPAEEAGTNQSAKRDHLNKLLTDVEPFATPKPEQLVKLALEISTNPGDLVLDSFLGSGTTAAVAQKMGRRWIGIEVGDHARTHCQPRLVKVVEGEQGGVSKDVGWLGGGGFSFYKLGVSVFDENGHIREGIRFEHLAAHIWFSETGSARSTRAPKEPFLGEHRGVGYYLLFNGILGDDSKTGGNVLTKKILRSLPPFDGPKVIYGEACALSDEQCRDLEIEFKQTPYDIKAR